MGLPGQDPFGAVTGRHHLDVGEGREAAQDRGLDAEVDDADPPGPPTVGPRGGPTVGTLTRHRGDEVDAVGAGLGGGGGSQVGLRSGAEGTHHGARRADVAGEATRVDVGEARQAVACEEAVQAPGGAPIAGHRHQVPHHEAPAERSAALEVGVGDPVVADVGVGEGDDLPGVGRIGENLLVAGHHGVEHHLTGSDTARWLGTRHLALEDLAVGEHQGAGTPGLGHHRCASPSMTTASPASSVWRTLPLRRRPT